MTGKYLPVREAAARLGVPPSMMQAMIKNGEVGAVKKGGTMMVSVDDIDGLLGQKQGRMAGDLAMTEVRVLDEFRQNLVQALGDEGVRQSLRECVGRADFQAQLLEALDLPEVRDKVAGIRKR
ncbi:MAG: helix-turn-helix domain-containing protein [Methanomicrobiales archaeon]|nr:helix-turn-helix domain-containing protein [Methanomicrobiales archaeon]